MNDLVGQALTEWLGFVRQAIKDKQQQENPDRISGEITEQETKEREEQIEIKRMKQMRKKGRPRLEENQKKWLRDKAGRAYRKNPFYVPKEKASGK